MNQTDIDIGTKVKHDTKGTGVLIFNRCRAGDQVVACEWDNKDNTISLVNVGDLWIKDGGETWIRIHDLYKGR